MESGLAVQRQHSSKISPYVLPGLSENLFLFEEPFPTHPVWRRMGCWRAYLYVRVHLTSTTGRPSRQGSSGRTRHLPVGRGVTETDGGGGTR